MTASSRAVALALVFTGVSFSALWQDKLATAAPPATQPAEITPTPASATPLCITTKWILWQTHELIAETAKHRAQHFVIRFYLQSRGGGRAKLIHTTRETNIRWQATVRDDGTVVLNFRSRLAWISLDGRVHTTKDLYPADGGRYIDPLLLFPDGVVLRNMQLKDEPVRGWFVPFGGDDLAWERKVPLTDEKGFRFPKAPIYYKLARHGDEIVWFDATGLHIVNVATGVRREWASKAHAVQAFDGRTAVGGNLAVDLASGKSSQLQDYFTFLAVHNNIGYAVKGVEQAIGAYGHPKNLELLAVDLNSGKTRTLAQWANSDTWYIADRGPMGQAFENRVKWDYAPALFADGPEGLTLWDGAVWRQFKWLSGFDKPAIDPDARPAPPATQPAAATSRRPGTYPYLKPEDRPAKAKEVLDPATDEKARYQAVWGLAISGYTRESAEALAVIAVDGARSDAIRECAAMGLINFTHSMPVEVRRALQDKLYGALNAEKEKLQGGIIRLLAAWGDADLVRKVLDNKLRDHPMEVIVLEGISCRETAVARLWEIYQAATPAKSGNIALSRAWHAGAALIHWRDRRGIDILLECLAVKDAEDADSASFRQSQHNTFMHLASALDNNFGYRAGRTWTPQLDEVIPKMVEWWKANRETWSFEEATSNVAPKVEPGKPLTERQARALAAKQANDAFAERTFKHANGQPVGRIELTPGQFNDVRQKDGRWILRMVVSAGPEAFVDFALDGTDARRSW